MQLIRGLYNLTAVHQHTAVTIGNFDGFHLGHQQIIARLKTVAQSQGLKTTVVLFEPQPKEFFLQEKAPARLMTLREKIIQLRAAGVDQVLCLRFDKNFAAMSPTAFAQEILVQGLAAKFVLVGDDFRFGAKRAGDVNFLTAFAQEQGIELAHMASCEAAGERVSSTAVRAALAVGDLNKVEQLLGRPYSMVGRVIHGDKRGRAIGFPTVNLPLHRQQPPMTGIYATLTTLANGQVVPGAANIGWRPTVDGKTPLLEVHLFDFDGDLYGQVLQVQFLHKLREEEKFPSVAAMTAQIGQDVAQVKAFFKEKHYE